MTTDDRLLMKMFLLLHKMRKMRVSLQPSLIGREPPKQHLLLSYCLSSPLHLWR